MHRNPKSLAWILLTGTAVWLSGCATLSEEECKTADWGRLGYKDGAAGHPESRLAEHAEACAKTGIRPLADIWRAGWDRGVRAYCVPSVGWNEGLAGRSYQGVCRGRGEEAFLPAYRAGADIHRLQSRLDSNTSEIKRLERELRQAQTDKERHRLRERLRDLDWEQSRLRRELGHLRSIAPRY
ncbi:MAG: DUF2799 domain-containing protein [Rhodoferax sp.]|nr:DUF2799 domain-containing protein [Rhodoferax sp.]